MHRRACSRDRITSAGRKRVRTESAYALAAAWIVVVGCKSYQPKPLQLQHYATVWAEQALDGEAVRAYAESITGVQPESTPFDPTDGLSLLEAEAVAVCFSPRLRIARAQVDVSAAVAREAGWWPDPQFELEVLRFINRGSETRFKFDGPSIDGVSGGGLESTPVGFRRVEGDFVDAPWIVGTSLSFMIPVSGRLAVEQDLRWSELDAAQRQLLVVQWEVVTQLREAWLEWSATAERASATREYVARLEEISEMSGHLAEAGEMKPTEARVLQIELARNRAKLQSLVADEERNRLTVLSLLGIAPNADVELAPAMYLPAIPESTEDRKPRLLANHPRLAAARAAYEVAEQRLKLEIRQQYPDLQLGPSYSFEEGFSRLGLGLGLPLPLWNRNRQAVMQAMAEREEARVRAEAELEYAIAELASVETQMDYATRQREYLLAEVVPLVDRQSQDGQTLLEMGEVDVLLLRDALTGSLQTKLDVLDATLAQARAANALEQMLQPRWVAPALVHPREAK